MKKKVKEVNDYLKKTENNLKAVSDSVEQLKQNEKNINNELSELNKKNNKLNFKYNNLKIVKKAKLKNNTINRFLIIECFDFNTSLKYNDFNINKIRYNYNNINSYSFLFLR